MGLVSCSGGTHLVDLAGASIAGLARSFKVNCVWQSDDQKLVLQNPPRSSGAVVVLSGVTNTQKWMTPDIFSCQRLLMLIRSVNNFIYSVKLANMLVLCLSIQHYVSTSPNATHAFPLLKSCTSFHHRKHHIFSFQMATKSRDSRYFALERYPLEPYGALMSWSCGEIPADSPVEVGSWNPIIYRVLAPSQVVIAGFLNHQHYPTWGRGNIIYSKVPL